MNEYTLEYLSQVFTPEYIDSLSILNDNLVSMGVSTHEEAIDILMPVSDSYEPSDLAQEVSNAIRGAAMETLSTVGILVSDEIPNPLLGTLIGFVGTFESSEDDEVILGYLENETDPKEAFMQILGLRTAVPADDWLEHLHGLTDDQLSNMYTLVQSWVESTESREQVLSNGDIDPAMATLHALYSKRDDTGMMERIRNDSVQPGASIESLLNLYGDHVASIEDLDTKVRSLVAIHVYSGEAYDHMYVETMESVRGFVLDDGVDTEMRVKRIVDEAINGMSW